MDNEKKVFPQNRKARPAMIDHMIEESRACVIQADLELTFIQHAKKVFAEAPHMLQLSPKEEELEMIYKYHLERLTFFKALRDKIKDKEEAKRIAKEVRETTPETIAVKTE
jgi:hypothetical protein